MKAHKIKWITWDAHIMVLFYNNVDTARFKKWKQKATTKTISLVSAQLHHLISVLMLWTNEWLNE